jgi:acyl-CoA reductase-like NAD-dependent aldehyde dehydrogenase
MAGDLLRETVRRMRGQGSEIPFHSIESAQEYLLLLSEAIEESRRDVAELAAAVNAHAERRQAALQIVAYNLKKLAFYVTMSRRILNDLRTLRRLLWDQRGSRADAREPLGGVAAAGPSPKPAAVRAPSTVT